MTLEIEPWSVWWVEFDPVQEREQAGRRPGLIVSSTFQLRLTGQALVSVLPLTTRLRQGWQHHVPINMPGEPPSYAFTEQIRTVSRSRLAGHRPICPRVSSAEIVRVRSVLRQMIDF